MLELEHISFLECNVYSGEYSKLKEKIKLDILNKKRNVIFAFNPLKANLASKDKSVRHVLQSADVLIPDGVGVIYAAKYLKRPIKERITGIDLMHAICSISTEINASIFIYGATQSNLEQAVEKLREKYSGIEIAGYINGYENDVNLINKMINESNADILFVACGSPLQENYIYHNKEHLPGVSLFLGVGGSIDVVSGNVNRAPEWIINLNLEWLYRIISQPKRIVHIKRIVEFLGEVRRKEACNQHER